MLINILQNTWIEHLIKLPEDFQFYSSKDLNLKCGKHFHILGKMQKRYITYRGYKVSFEIRKV